MNSRVLLIRIFLITIVLVLIGRLFMIQIVDTKYRAAAQSNILHKIVEYPYRGMIYDRNNRLLTQNEPVYDVMIIPKELTLEDSVEIKELFRITQREFIRKYQKQEGIHKSYPHCSLISYPILNSHEFRTDLSNLMVSSFNPEQFDLMIINL